MQQQTAEAFEPRKLTRAFDPNTSHEAAARVTEFGHQHHARILDALRDIGDGTMHEIAAHCSLEAHAVGRRLKEMNDAGLIEPKWVGGWIVVRPSPSGRKARVWRIKAVAAT